MGVQIFPPALRRTDIAHGGEREGAGRKAKPTGRPRKPRTTEEFNQSFDQKAVSKLPELFETIYAIAQGIKVAAYSEPRKGKSTKMADEAGAPIWVYSVPPDKAAVFYLIDRAAGRAAVKKDEHVETELILEFNMPDDTEQGDELDDSDPE